jgi:hypothetical protein
MRIIAHPQLSQRGANFSKLTRYSSFVKASCHFADDYRISAGPGIATVGESGFRRAAVN